MYKLVKPDAVTNTTNVVIRTTDMAIIPFDPANTDYQEYLQFLADGGVPEPADE